MLPLKITVRSISDSPVISFYINKRYSKVNRLHRKIHSCHVIIDTEQKHGLKGKLFSVHVELAIPDKKLVSKKQGFNLFVAMRDAFDTLEHNLSKYRKRKVVKLQHYRRPHVSMNNSPVLPEAS